MRVIGILTDLNVAGVPIVYPRMSIAENILGSKLNPLNLVAKFSPGHLAGYTNKFDQNVELLDDLVSMANRRPLRIRLTRVRSRRTITGAPSLTRGSVTPWS